MDETPMRKMNLDYGRHLFLKVTYILLYYYKIQFFGKRASAICEDKQTRDFMLIWHSAGQYEG